MKTLQLLLVFASLKCTVGFFVGEPNFKLFPGVGTRNLESSPNHLAIPTHRTNATTAFDRKSKTSLAFAPNGIHSQSTTATTRPSSFQIYCDLDGVLVDFEGGVKTLTGEATANIAKQTMWKHVVKANAFFENLGWTSDGQVLWNAIKHLQPDILTGCPSYESSRKEKFHWCQQQLGVATNHVDMASIFRDHQSVNGNCPQEGVTNVITCWSENKFRECTVGSILIDDREDLRRNWERAGGLFVHHTNADDTIRQLREHGIL